MYKFDFINKKYPRWFNSRLTSSGYACFQAHRHNHIELLLPVEGSFKFNADSVMYSLAPGDVFLVNPGHIHYGFMTPGDACAYGVLQISPELLIKRGSCGAGDLLQKLADGKLRLPAFLPAGSPAAELCGTVYALERQKRNLLTAAVNAELNASAAPADSADILWENGCIDLLFGGLARFGCLTEAAPSERADKKPRFIDQTQSLILSEFRRELTSAEAARRLSYDHAYFCRALKKCYGAPFGAYLLEYRIRAATKLRPDSFPTLADLARSVGFPNYSYFHRSFTRIVGVTPSAYYGGRNGETRDAGAR